MDHPDSLTLRALSQGALDTENTREVQEHVGGCAQCARELTRNEDRSLNATPALSDVEMSAADLMPKPLSKGQQLGRYVVLGTLGQGGMGVVYGAFDPELDRQVALKLLFAGGSRDATQTLRLQREARAMAKLSHPNVLAVHDVGMAEDGAVYIAMDFVEGETLTSWLRREPRKWPQVLEKLMDAGRGLKAAHQAGIAHRDFKPDNVLVHKDGRVFVTDFGLAKASAEPDPPVDPGVNEPALTPSRGLSLLSVDVTQAHQIIGTPAYMAPEQFRGVPGDALSDQFSFGVTLYQALYGERPFTAPLPGAPRVYKVPDAPRGSEVPPFLRKVALRCLSEERAARYPDMGAVLQALADDPSRRRRQVALGVAAGVLLLAVAAGALYVGHRQAASCEATGADIFEVWGPAQANDVTAAFNATHANGASDAASHAISLLSSYTQRWTRERRDACEATRIRGDQSDEVLSLRMACLDRRRESLGALVDALKQPDATTVAKSVDAVLGLPRLEDCRDAQALRRPIPLAQEGVQRERVKALQVRLAQAKVRQQTGHALEAAPLAEQIAKEAQEVGYRPLQAEALLLESMALTNKDAKVRQLFDQVVWTALAGHADEIALEGLEKRVSGDWSLRHFDEAREHVQAVSSMLERLGASDRLLCLALPYLSYGETDAAHVEVSLQKAITLCRRVFGENSIEFIDTQEDLGRRMQDFERWQISYDALSTTLLSLGRLYPEGHPRTASTLLNLARAANHLHRYRRAAELDERAISLSERAFGANAMIVLVTKMNLSGVYSALGQNQRAFELAHTARLAFEAQLGPRENLTSMAREGEIDTDIELGKLPEARAMLEEMLAFPPGVVEPNVLLELKTQDARLRWLRGDALGARAEAEAVLAKMNPDDEARGAAELILAQALFSLHAPREEVQRHAQAAQHDFERAALTPDLEREAAWAQKAGVTLATSTATSTPGTTRPF